MQPTNAILQAGSGPNKYQMAIAVGVLGAAILLLAVGMWRTQYTGLSDRQAKHKSTLRAQYDSKTPTSLKLPTDADFRSHRDRVASLWSDDPETEDHTSIRDAAGSAHRELLDSWQRVTGRVPRLAIWLLEEGVAVIILGALAVVSAEQWERLFQSGGDGFSSTDVLEGLVSLTTTLVDAGFTILGMFPYGNMVWAFAVAYGMLAYELLYQHWYAVGLALLLGGVLLAVLDRLTPSVDASVHLRDRDLGYRLVTAVVAIWVAGVTPTLFGQLVGLETIGAVAGFLIAFVVTCVLGYIGAKTAYHHFRFKTLDRDTEKDLESYLMAAYIAVCRGYAILAAVAATLIPVYLVVILANGRLFDVWAAFSAGSTDMKAIVGLLVVGVLAVLAYEIQDAWPDLRASIGHVLSSKSVRLALFGRAMPFGAVGAAYLVAFGMYQSVVLAAALALGVGALARGGYLLLMRARYQMELFETPEQTPRRILVEAYRLEDADGTERYVATINRERVARDSVDALVDELLEHAESLSDGGEYADTFGQHYADHILEYGIVGEDNSRKKLRERIRKVVYAPLKRQQNHSRVEESEIDDDLGKYPDPIVDERLQTFRMKGTRDGRVFQRDGYYVLER